MCHRGYSWGSVNNARCKYASYKYDVSFLLFSKKIDRLKRSLFSHVTNFNCLDIGSNTRTYDHTEYAKLTRSSGWLCICVRQGDRCADDVFFADCVLPSRSCMHLRSHYNSYANISGITSHHGDSSSDTYLYHSICNDAMYTTLLSPNTPPNVSMLHQFYHLVKSQHPRRR